MTIMIKINHLWKSDRQRSSKHQQLFQNTEAEENTLGRKKKNKKPPTNVNGFIKQSCDLHKFDLKIKNMNNFRRTEWPRQDIAFKEHLAWFWLLVIV